LVAAGQAVAIQEGFSMNFIRRRRLVQSVGILSLAVLILVPIGCGPEDYQKPLQQFQDSSTVVINTARAFLNNENTIEQDSTIDEVVFQRKPLNLAEIKKIEIISPQEIEIRTKALDALAEYTSNLAQLAQGKAGSAVGDQTKKVSDSLKTLAGDAKKLPATKLDNPKFSGIASAAASAIGDVAQLMVEHKARREIEQSIESNDAAVTALIQQISDDATGSYLRQQAQLGAYGVQLSRDYQIEIGRENADPILLLGFAKTVKDYRLQESQLASANPAPAIEKMKKAHSALVAYVKSSKDPKTFAELKKAVQDFVSAAQPLGQAVQSLVSAS
jgi:hypothetical protein